MRRGKGRQRDERRTDWVFVHRAAVVHGDAFARGMHGEFVREVEIVVDDDRACVRVVVDAIEPARTLVGQVRRVDHRHSHEDEEVEEHRGIQDAPPAEPSVPAIEFSQHRSHSSAAFHLTRMSRRIIDSHRMKRQPSMGRNVVSNWLALGTAVLCALVLTPVIVRSLQTERYGIWSFLNGLVAYSDLLYLGLGSALIRFVARARADGAHASVNRLAAVVLSIYTTLGVLSFGLLAAASRFVPSMFAETLPAATAHSASYVCVLLGV